MKTKNKEDIIQYFFYSTALFLLIPNVLKEIPFVLFSIYYIYYHYQEINKKKMFLITLFFGINFLSLLYSDDIKYGLRRIEGFLPFIYLAVPYTIQNKFKINIFRWSKIFNYVNILFLLGFFLYSIFTSGLSLSYNQIRTNFEQIPLISIHPIYLSIVGFIGFITTIKYVNNKIGLLFILNNLILIFLSGTRSTLFFLILIILILLFTKHIQKKQKIFLGMIMLISVVVFSTIKTDYRNRLREMILPVSYNQFNIKNSTSVRNAVWNCAKQRLKKTNLFIGNGVGDSQYVLDQCFKITHSDLIGYNTHNQYMGIIISTGLLGLLAFLLLIIGVSCWDMNYKNIYFLIILSFFLFIFMFENAIERKNGILLFLFSLYFLFNNKEKNTISVNNN